MADFIGGQQPPSDDGGEDDGGGGGGGRRGNAAKKVACVVLGSWAAEFTTFPLDLVKTRLQIQGKKRCTQAVFPPFLSQPKKKGGGVLERFLFR